MTIGLAVLAAGLRICEFVFAYEPGTELMTALHPASIAVASVSALAIALLFLFRGRSVPEAAPSSGPLWLVVEFLACLSLTGSALFDAQRALERGTVSLLVFAALTLLALIVLLLCGRNFSDGKKNFTRGFYLTIPVFWGCYWLILDFWDHAANPMLLSYLYNMAAIIFLTLALHSAAGISFGRAKAHVTRLLAFCAVFFSLTTLGSTQLAGLFLSPGTTFSAMTLTPALLCRHIFVVLHMSFVGLRAAGNTSLTEDSPATPL